MIEFFLSVLLGILGLMLMAPIVIGLFFLIEIFVGFFKRD